MERYQSKEALLQRPVEEVYARFSDLSGLTPFVEGKVDDWQADADTASMRVAGFPVNLRVAERIENRLVRVASDEGTPLGFTLGVQMQPAAEGQTRLRFVLEAELNMMMKMMLGGKIQQGLDTMAETLEKNSR